MSRIKKPGGFEDADKHSNLFANLWNTTVISLSTGGKPAAPLTRGTVFVVNGVFFAKGDTKHAPGKGHHQNEHSAEHSHGYTKDHISPHDFHLIML